MCQHDTSTHQLYTLLQVMLCMQRLTLGGMGLDLNDLIRLVEDDQPEEAFIFGDERDSTIAKDMERAFDFASEENGTPSSQHIKPLPSPQLDIDPSTSAGDSNESRARPQASASRLSLSGSGIRYSSPYLSRPSPLAKDTTEQVSPPPSYHEAMVHPRSNTSIMSEQPQQQHQQQQHRPKQQEEPPQRFPSTSRPSSTNRPHLVSDSLGLD